MHLVHMPVEGVRSFGNGVISGSEPPCMSQELNTGSLQVQQTLLIFEPSLQPLCLISDYILLILNIEVFGFFFLLLIYEYTNFNIYYVAGSKDTIIGQKMFFFPLSIIFFGFPER